MISSQQVALSLHAAQTNEWTPPAACCTNISGLIPRSYLRYCILRRNHNQSYTFMGVRCHLKVNTTHLTLHCMRIRNSPHPTTETNRSKQKTPQTPPLTGGCESSLLLSDMSSRRKHVHSFIWKKGKCLNSVVKWSFFNGVLVSGKTFESQVSLQL